MSEYIPTISEQIAGVLVTTDTQTLMQPPPASSGFEWQVLALDGIEVEAAAPRRWQVFRQSPEQGSVSPVMHPEPIYVSSPLCIQPGRPAARLPEHWGGIISPDSPFLWNEVAVLAGKTSSLTMLNPFEDRMLAYTQIQTRLSLELQQIESLEDNWDEDGAPSISRASLSTAKVLSRSAALLAALGDAVEKPYFIPLPDGDLLFKWGSPHRELSVTIRDSVLEVMRWQPRDAYEAQGYWETSTSGIREHLSWLVQ